MAIHAETLIEFSRSGHGGGGTKAKCPTACYIAPPLIPPPGERRTVGLSQRDWLPVEGGWDSSLTYAVAQVTSTIPTQAPRLCHQRSPCQRPSPLAGAPFVRSYMKV